MALTAMDYGEDAPMPFPAFLARRESAPPSSRRGSWLGPIVALIAKIKSPTEIIMRNAMDIQEIPTIGRAQISQPIAEDEDRLLIDAMLRPLEAIRAILGERAANEVLRGLLRQSNAKLESYGASSPDQESGELKRLRTQLAQAQQINKEGHSAYRKLAAELDALREGFEPEAA